MAVNVLKYIFSFIFYLSGGKTYQPALVNIIKNVNYCVATHSMESEAHRPVNEWINDHAMTPKYHCRRKWNYELDSHVSYYMNLH